MNRELVDAMLRGLGLPPATEAVPFARSRRYAMWKLTLEDGSMHMLRIAVAPAGHRGIAHEVAARAVLHTTEVPRVQACRAVPVEVFGVPASLASWMPGLDGRGVLDVHPDSYADLAALCGRVARVVELDTAGRYGLSVVDGRFVPIRPSWGEEYLAQVHDWFHRANAVGASLGGVGDALLARLIALAPHLGDARRFSLVHGDLNPTNLLLQVGEPPAKDSPPAVDVIGVVDWELASMGDPLIELACALELPDAALAHFLDGYGPVEAREALVGSGPERVECYAIGRVFQVLALVVAAQIEGGGPMWGFGMAYAARLARERLEPGFARARLDAALGLEALPPAAPLPDAITPVAGALRRAVGRLTCRPVLGWSALGPWMGAVAAALRDPAHPDEGWVRDAHLYLDVLGPELELRHFEPIGPRGPWMGAMDARVRALAAEDGLLLGLWWLGVEALALASGTAVPGSWSVSDHALRGLQSFIETIGSSPNKPDGIPGVLLHTLVSAAAARSLAHLSGTEVDASIEASRMARLLEAWEDYTVFEGAPEPWVAGQRPAPAADPSAWLIPVVLLAASRVPDLPVPAAELVGVICRGLNRGPPGERPNV